MKWQNLDSLTFKQELSNGEVDLCFILSNPLQDKNLDTYKLTEERMMFVYPEGHKFNDFKELDDYITFCTEKGCSYRLLLEDFIEEKHIYPKSTIESWSVETIKQAVINGMG